MRRCAVGPLQRIHAAQLLLHGMSCMLLATCWRLLRSKMRGDVRDIQGVVFDERAVNTLLCWTLLTKPSEKDAHQENSAGLSNCRELESFIIDWGECLCRTLLRKPTPLRRKLIKKQRAESSVLVEQTRLQQQQDLNIQLLPALPLWRLCVQAAQLLLLEVRNSLMSI